MDRMPKITEKIVEKEPEIVPQGRPDPEPLKEELRQDEFNDNKTMELNEWEDSAMSEEEEEQQVVEDKPKLDNKNIFKYKKGDGNLKVKKVAKPKRVISEEQKERLRKGRETALANRRAKAAARAKGKDNSVQKPEVVEEVAKEPPEPNMPEQKQPHREVKNEPQFTKEELMDMVSKASQKALEDNEILRQQRKEKKKKDQQVEAERNRVRETIKRATTPGLNPTNPWSNCY